jgi:poly[(R)-3-hydroxyalkanoate] polymerase subunit PhaC
LWSTVARPSFSLRSAPAVFGNIGREIDRSIQRGRNGIRYFRGDNRSQVGQTPKETVWTKDKVELWRYANSHVTQGTPVLLVMSVVTRSYIFDLLPGDSFVEQLIAAGYDVFLIDWGVPDASDSQNTLETYVDSYLPHAVDVMCRRFGYDDVSVVGYCLGGMFALLCAAGNPNVRIRNLVLVATPIDYAAMGLPVTLIREGRLDPETLIDDTGNVPPNVLLNSFRLRNPTAELAQYANLVERLWNEEYVRAFQAMNQWIHDHIPFPGALARQMVALLARGNQLMTGQIQLNRRRIRLDAVTCPVLNVMAEKDDVVPLASATPVKALVGTSDFEELRVPAGHVALVTGRLGRTVTVPRIIEWLGRHARQLEADAVP